MSLVKTLNHNNLSNIMVCYLLLFYVFCYCIKINITYFCNVELNAKKSLALI